MLMKTIIRNFWLTLVPLIAISSVSFAQTIVTDIDTATFRTIFNANSDKTRIAAIFDPKCPQCVGHANDLRTQVYDQCDNTELVGMIIWLRTTGFLTLKSDAEAEASLWSDSRVQHYWATNIDEFPNAFATFSWIGCVYAWDISMLFSVGSVWNGAEPTTTDWCTAKIAGCCNSYSMSNLKNAVDNLTACGILDSPDEQQDEHTVRITPNPNSGILTIDLDRQLKDQVNVAFFNSVGQKISSKESQLNNSSVQFDITEYPKGIYFVRIESGSDIITRKLIKY